MNQKLDASTRADARLSLTIPHSMRQSVERYQALVARRTGVQISLNSAASSLLKQAIQANSV